jgi:hypothetical protein
MGTTDKAWQRLGRIDPCFAVSAHPRFATLRRLSDNGIGAIHHVYARRAAGRRRFSRKLRATFPFVKGLANLVKGASFIHSYFEMNSYDVRRVFLRLQKQGRHRVHIRFSDHDFTKA